MNTNHFVNPSSQVPNQLYSHLILLSKSQLRERYQRILLRQTDPVMSRGLFSNSRDFGLSSDDDEDSGGALIRDGHARGASSNRLVNSSSSPGAHQGYNRGQKPGGPTRSSGKNQSSRHSHGSSRHAYSTQNSVSLADFDKEFVDIDDDDDDNDEDNDRVRRKGGRGGGVGGGGHRQNFGRGAGGSRSRLGGAVDWTSEVTKLLLTSSKWKLAMVGLLLGLLCAVAHQSYLWVTSERSSSGNGFIYLLYLSLSLWICPAYKLIKICLLISLSLCVCVCVCVFACFFIIDNLLKCTADAQEVRFIHACYLQLIYLPPPPSLSLPLALSISLPTQASSPSSRCCQTSRSQESRYIPVYIYTCTL